MRRWKNLILVCGIMLAAGAAGFFDFPTLVNQSISAFNRNQGLLDIPMLPETPFHLGLDLQGGVHLIYEADLSSAGSEDYDSLMRGLRDVMERRVNTFGVAEPVIQIQGEGSTQRLIVELAGVRDPKEAIGRINDAPLLEFKELLPEEERERRVKEILAVFADPVADPEFSSELRCQLDFGFVNRALTELGQDPCYISSSPRLTGEHVERATVGLDNLTGEALVSLQFNDTGAEIFEQVTARSLQKPLAIYLDGRIINAPTVQAIIGGGTAQISGNFQLEEARALARNLNAGAVPVPIKLVSQQQVGPTLGKVSLDQSLRAGLIGLALVAIFMIMFYRMPGFFATVALGIYVLFVLMVFKIIGVTLTLAGIAGFILSVGMAVDANILIFSRMREELAQKRDLASAIEEGFRRAWPSIRDGNVTTLLVAVILFWFGSTFVQGFALTLSIGILLSMFSAIFVTRSFMRLFLQTYLQRIQWLWK